MFQNFLPFEDEVTCVSTHYNSGSSDSAAVASGTHRRMVSAGYPTSLLFYHLGDKADAEVLKALKCSVFSGDAER